MTIIQKLTNFYKKNSNLTNFFKINKIKIINTNHTIFLSLIILFAIIFYAATSLISNNNVEKKGNLQMVTNSSEFSKFTDFLLGKINSPYKEINYTIKSLLISYYF